MTKSAYAVAPRSCSRRSRDVRGVQLYDLLSVASAVALPDVFTDSMVYAFSAVTCSMLVIVRSRRYWVWGVFRYTRIYYILVPVVCFFFFCVSIPFYSYWNSWLSIHFSLWLNTLYVALLLHFSWGNVFLPIKCSLVSVVLSRFIIVACIWIFDIVYTHQTEKRLILTLWNCIEGIIFEYMTNRKQIMLTRKK
jgi:hypothetical protein